MKGWQKILIGIAIFFVVLIATIKLTGHGYLLKAASATYLRGYTSASIGDAKYFDTHEIAASDDVWEWPLHAEYNKNELPGRLLESLEGTNSVAFLVIKDGQILHEHYWDDYSESSHSNSFSMAKSITTMLTQIAIQNGVLEGWNQKVQDILPDLKGEYAAELELWHLSTMSSGLDWDEHYSNPFSVTARAYYGADINELMYTLEIVDKPGQKFNYQSGSTQILGMVLMKATGKSLAELASEWLWKPMGAKHDAKWHTDDNGTEMAYCCFNTNARDFARFGKLMSSGGNWNGTQLIDSEFVELASVGALAPQYGYSFWVDPNVGTPVFAQRGILGQYIINMPEKNLVVVRLGHQRTEMAADHHPDGFHVIVEETLKMAD